MKKPSSDQKFQSEYSKLAQVIHDTCKGKPVYFICNAGNWGDALIRQGTLKFFRDIGLRFYELLLPRGNFVKLVDRYLPLAIRGNLIFGGGGSWCNLWDRSIKLMNSVATTYKQVIVLPSTYENRVGFSNIIYFSRDRFESLQTVPEAHFCHDMSFYLQWQTAGKGTGVGYFFRTDEESSGKISVPPSNVDLSGQRNYLTSIAPFFNAVDVFQTIHTDRLHVGIAACLLKKELHLYPGAYFKNKAVFCSSMVGNFEQIHFHDL